MGWDPCPSEVLPVVWGLGVTKHMLWHTACVHWCDGCELPHTATFVTEDKCIVCCIFEAFVQLPTTTSPAGVLLMQGVGWTCQAAGGCKHSRLAARIAAASLAVLHVHHTDSGTHAYVKALYQYEAGHRQSYILSLTSPAST